MARSPVLLNDFLSDELLNSLNKTSPVIYSDTVFGELVLHSSDSLLMTSPVLEDVSGIPASTVTARNAGSDTLLAPPIIREPIVPIVIDKAGKTAPPRWSEIVRNNAQEGMSLNYVEESAKSEEVAIDMEDIEEELNFWKFTLMGNVIGPKPTLKQVKDFVDKSWAHIASPVVQYYKKGLFSFRFRSLKDMSDVLKEGPWKLGTNSIILKQWSPMFSTEMELITVVPVWVLFPGLDPYLWSETVLRKLSSKVGKPLFVDKTTTNKARLSFARVMVEVDVSAPLVDHILVHNPFTGHDYQKVAYEWVPYFCSGCKKLGHQVSHCKWRKKENEAVEVPGQPTTESPPKVGDLDSRRQTLGGTSGPDGQPLIAVNEEVNLESRLPSSFSVIETPILEAVKHSACAELGPGSSHLDGLFSMVKGALNGTLLAGANTDLAVVTSNSFDALNEVIVPVDDIVDLGSGCNNPLKLKEVLDFLIRGNIDVLALLETRIRRGKAVKVIQNHLGQYNVLCKYDWHRNGKIWVVWNPTTVTVTLIEMAAQFVHCKITHHVSCSQFHTSFVYASNDGQIRRDLWFDLCRLSLKTTDWMVLGDFNVDRNVEERVSSHLPMFSDIMEFNQCVLSCGLEDIQGSGCEFTWTNKQDGARVYWLHNFPLVSVAFLPPGISEHSPVMVTLLGTKRFKRRFSFLNCWTKDPSYLDQIKQVWHTSEEGSSMFTFFSKLRNVRYRLTRLHRSKFSNFKERVDLSRRRLDDYQLKLQASSLNDMLIAEDILKQKAKFDGTLYNDSGTKYFYARINERRHMQMIGEILDRHGNARQGTEGVAAGFIEYYQHLLGNSILVSDLDLASIEGSTVQQEDWAQLLALVADSDIKKAMENIDPLKSPGSLCVKEYFRTGCMLKQANATLLALIPKKKIVNSFLDFRAISCCSVVYKVITKILFSRLQNLMPDLVGAELAAFVK
ncbi:hypothetical protein RND81_14G146600 [Saponaria officinalis]|uniref:DUF4283 domain-containing protein n=1 Tax=Saponaria officinalis TaxID=3572 RepID=A0AAW1GQW2_SAPOF